MIRLLMLMLFMSDLSLTNVWGKEDVKDSPTRKAPMDELKAPNVLKTQNKFIFKDFIISLTDPEKQFYIIINLELTRDTTLPSEEQEEAVPLIIDALISDLHPALNLFGRDAQPDLAQSLQKRISRVLMPKFPWIINVNVLGARLQIRQKR